MGPSGRVASIGLKRRNDTLHGVYGYVTPCAIYTTITQHPGSLASSKAMSSAVLFEPVH